MSAARKFVAIDAEAAEEIVSTRFFQSEDFEEGRALGNILAGAAPQRHLAPHTFIVAAEAGLYFLSDRSDHKNVLVIDTENAPVFADCSSKDALLRFQKLLRFARRRWTKVSPSHGERLIAGSSKAVIFPYPITSQSQTRITVEMAPDRKRRERRASGMEMLAYRVGEDEGGGPFEEAPVTNFRKALDGLSSASRDLVQEEQSQPDAGRQVNSLAVTRLNLGGVIGGLSGCSFDDWQHYLTDAQKEFIERPLTAPHRIEGPAGTGKTLSLVLKCIAQIRRAKAEKQEHRALFVSHSEATKKTIESLFESEPSLSNSSGGLLSLQTVKITTLQELCSELLRYEISDIELLDRDAFESKQSQLLYAVEALQEVMAADFKSHRPHMSATYAEFLTKTDAWAASEMLQHEISVMIKGRADEDLERYKKLPRLSYGLPVRNEGDKALTFLMFNAYQRRLRTSGQFDTDDVVLSALHQLDTPIWRRRRETEGYDSIYVDETHLFNINELSVFHRLTRAIDRFPIAYSADVSQSLGDRGWSDVDFAEALLGPASADQRTDQTVFSSIFRCSPDIVNLAFSVTSAGATLFTNFHDPLAAASSAFTEIEERKCARPIYKLLASDDSMIFESFAMADKFAQEMEASRGDVAIIVFGDEMFARAEKMARDGNKPIELLKHRGDLEIVRKARTSGRFVLSTPEFVGGLEFDGVVLVGVDRGRVPPKVTAGSLDSENFLSYATHQRLYVAITRARYRVAILGVKARGASDIFSNAIVTNALEVQGSG